MLYFCGYFPKLIQPVPAGPTGFDGLGLVDIASVSCCIVPGPPDWIRPWRHNELGFFESIEEAESVVPPAEVERYDLHGYQFLDQLFDAGKPAAWDPSVVLQAPSEFEILGFDAVSRSTSSFFECSPLSCNYAAATVAHNEHCLFSSLEEAVQAAATFSSGGAEPGPYHVAQVLRRRRPK